MPIGDCRNQTPADIHLNLAVRSIEVCLFIVYVCECALPSMNGGQRFLAADGEVQIANKAKGLVVKPLTHTHTYTILKSTAWAITSTKLEWRAINLVVSERISRLSHGLRATASED